MGMLDPETGDPCLLEPIELFLCREELENLATDHFVLDLCRLGHARQIRAGQFVETGVHQDPTGDHAFRPVGTELARALL